MIKITHDEESDSLYLKFIDLPISHSIEATDDILLDMSGDTLVGMDVHNWSLVQKEQLEAAATGTDAIETRFLLQMAHA